jgi:hypothetical protein
VGLQAVAGVVAVVVVTFVVVVWWRALKWGTRGAGRVCEEGRQKGRERRETVKAPRPHARRQEETAQQRRMESPRRLRPSRTRMPVVLWRRT